LDWAFLAGIFPKRQSAGGATCLARLEQSPRDVNDPFSSAKAASGASKWTKSPYEFRVRSPWAQNEITQGNHETRLAPVDLRNATKTLT
jgi:hypothetical protein